MAGEEIRPTTTESTEKRIEIPDDHPGQERIKSLKKMPDPRQHLPLYYNMFLICCVVAPSLDALFFYIPFINDHKKCMGMDETLKNMVLFLRSVIDINYIMFIAIQICSDYTAPPSESTGSLPKSEKVIDRIMGAIQRINWKMIALNILCALPIQQMVVLVYFSKMKGSKSLNWTIINLVLLLQFVPRILHIYHSCKELSKNLGPTAITIPALDKGLFNFFLYIVASHLFGAAWYFFSVQRELACWQQACKGNSMCNQSNFSCKHRNKIVNDPVIGYLNLSCPLDSPSRFDFGIFAPALKSGVVYSKDFLRKFFYCFAWGVRNLSSFGSNLETSAYFWESLFSTATTVIGLLLFIYLIGNLQTFLQFSAADSEKRIRKMAEQEVRVDKLMKNQGIPPKRRKELIHYVAQRIPENEDVNLKNVIEVLSRESKKRLKQRLCQPIMLKKTDIARVGDTRPKLDAVYDYLIQTLYIENACIVQQGKPLDKIIIIIQGQLKIDSCDKEVKYLKTGQIYGEELVEWAISTPLKLESNSFPVSKETVTAVTRVEAFVLSAIDFQTLLHQYLLLSPKKLKGSPEYKEKWASSAVHVLLAARQRYIISYPSA